MLDRKPISRREGVAIATLLNQRFGDRSVYLHGSDDRVLLKRAMQLGYVNEEGYVTRVGHQLCQTLEY